MLSEAILGLPPQSVSRPFCRCDRNLRVPPARRLSADLLGYRSARFCRGRVLSAEALSATAMQALLTGVKRRERLAKARAVLLIKGSPVLGRGLLPWSRGRRALAFLPPHVIE